MFKFHAQNTIGKEGESLFQTLYPQFKANNVSNVTEPDFVDDKGRKAEIKFDVSERARRNAHGRCGFRVLLEQYASEACANRAHRGTGARCQHLLCPDR